EDNVSSAQDSMDAGIDEEVQKTAVEEVIPPAVPEAGEADGGAEEAQAPAAEAELAKLAEDAEEDRPEEDELEVTQVASDVMAQGAQAGERKSRRAFTQQQMREMIRNHAFSSGFQSYKQFAARPVPQDDDDI
ncbi:unnamed protein product, partial [Symbiodinium pilosum]